MMKFMLILIMIKVCEYKSNIYYGECKGSIIIKIDLLEPKLYAMREKLKEKNILQVKETFDFSSFI